MQSFSISPANPNGQRNYVFVDEHNRHKRLKVMRACEGCRRRKIKCDSASSNQWPCAACTRLKLHCVPPTGGNDRDYTGTGSLADSEDPVEYSVSQTHGLNALHAESQSHQFTSMPNMPSNETTTTYDRPDVLYELGPVPYGPDGYRQQYPLHGQASYSTSHPSIQESQPYYPPQPQPQMRHDSSASTAGSDHTTAQELSDQLGELKIGEIGIAPYARQQKQYDAEPEGPVHDDEIKLPPLSNTAGSQIRIPPALMPAEEDALQYFKIFFADVHPYVPVVIRLHFYQQWQSNRDSISPLLLEGIFACAGRMSDDPAQGAQWLALANRHEECFLDTPRLSTLQALLLLLKAREAAPKRGYYYRSWMTCKTIVSMAKDLDLHEHYTTHEEGGSCGSDPVECLTKTRIWQTILICEMMVGAPQGRVDFGVDPNTIDIRPNPPCSNIDEYEASLSRQFAYFIRNARNIRLVTDAAHKAKKNKDWGLDPKLVAYNVAFSNWPNELPPDLQLSLQSDGSVPWLPSHFVGNMHSHYRLGILMLHRAQLVASQSFANDDAWKRHMTVCYSSAKIMCRLQEAILQHFGLTGLLCMQRGINFTIYAILTCTMIHLIAITSPDPDFHTDAREYFTRHMRVLEQCISAWPMPEVEAQINALRVAFSANIKKPFELKPSFPYGSPSEPHEPSPPLDTQYLNLQTQLNPHYDQQRQYSHPAQTLLTPPISAGAADSGTDSPNFHRPFVPPSYSQPVPPMHQQQAIAVTEVQWNPTPIIDQWNTAFAIPPSAIAPPPHSSVSSSTNMPPILHHHTQSVSPPQVPHTYAASYPHPMMPSVPQQQPHLHQQQYIPQQQHPQQQQQQQQFQQTMPQAQQNSYVQDAPIFVTPREWQQSVASVFDPAGLKRRYDYSSAQDAGEHTQKRVR